MGVSAYVRSNQLLAFKALLVTLLIIVGLHLYSGLSYTRSDSPSWPSTTQHAPSDADPTSKDGTKDDGGGGYSYHNLPPTEKGQYGSLISHNPGAKPPADFHFTIAPTVDEHNGGIKGLELPELDDYEVRGNKLSKFLETPPLYDLHPFPHSPVPHGRDVPHHPWLAAVIGSAFDPGRRMLIRNTWMATYKDAPVDMKFVIGNPGPAWSEVIQRENRTFGDLIVLDHIQEDDFTANTVKTLELYRYLSDKSPRKYAVVSKVDTDLWLNVPAYFDQKIRALISDEGELVANRTVIGQFYWDNRFKLALPHGAVYTLTWDLVELLPKLQWKYNVVRNEDMMVSWLLILAKQRVTFQYLTQEEKFDFLRKDTIPGTGWARTNAGINRQFHGVYGKKVLAVHLMKKAEDWLMVAACFDRNGIKDMPPPPEDLGEVEPVEDKDYRTPWFKNIPEKYWETDGNGNTIISGVYTLEPGVGPYFKRKE